MIDRAAQLREQIDRSAAWWHDHGDSVRQASAETYRTHCRRMIYDSVYREREKLGEKMSYAFVHRLGLHKAQKPSRHGRSYVGGELAEVGGKIARIGDSEDSPFTDCRPPVASELRQYERDLAEKEFLEFAQAETGMQLSEKEYKKLKRRQRDTLRQSKAVAEKLMAAAEEAAEGKADDVAEQIRVRYDPYRHDEYSLYVWWLHSKTLEELPKYRRICLLPYVAAMTRAPKLAALEYFLQENPYSRFWTFTTGPRCTVEDIPDRLDWLFEMLRELNKELGRRYGVQIVFRTTEFGSLESEGRDASGHRADGQEGGEIGRDSEGRALYHPHAHCVMHSTRGYIKPEVWTDMINFVHSFWHRDGEKVVWLADGLIRDARECCKYVTKPGDILKLANPELLAFFDATRGRRLVRPMGVLAEQIRARRETGRILRRKRIGSRMTWTETVNHNRLDAQTEEEKEAMRNIQDAYALTEECERLASVEPPSQPGALDGGCVTVQPSSVEVTKVMARIGPAAGPTPYKEPRVIVMTNRATPDLKAVTHHPLVFRLWAQTVAEWEAGRAASALINVHTGTLSGEEFQDDIPGLESPPDTDGHLRPFLGTELPVFANA